MNTNNLLNSKRSLERQAWDTTFGFSAFRHRQCPLKPNSKRIGVRMAKGDQVVELQAALGDNAARHQMKKGKIVPITTVRSGVDFNHYVKTEGLI